MQRPRTRQDMNVTVRSTCVFVRFDYTLFLILLYSLVYPIFVEEEKIKRIKRVEIFVPVSLTFFYSLAESFHYCFQILFLFKSKET